MSGSILGFASRRVVVPPARPIMFTDQGQWAADSPYLVVPHEIAHSWCPHERVTRLPSRDDHENTRYWQICESASVNPVGLFKLGDSHGMYIGGLDLPLATWFGDGDGKGGDIVIPVEWTHQSTAEELAAEVASIPGDQFHDERLTLQVGKQGLLLFTAADEGPDWHGSTVRIDIRPGDYSVWSNESQCGSFLLRVYALVPRETS